MRVSKPGWAAALGRSNRSTLTPLGPNGQADQEGEQGFCRPGVGLRRASDGVPWRMRVPVIESPAAATWPVTPTLFAVPFPSAPSLPTSVVLYAGCL